MPRPKDNTPRCGEPFYDEDRARWSVMERDAAGDRRRHRFETQGEAVAFVAAYRRETQDQALTLQGALDRYAEDQEARRLAPTTRATTQHRLKVLRPLYAASLASMTPARWKACFDAYRPKSDTTRHSTHRELKMFAAWLLRERKVGVDLASTCVFVGQISKGKAQLRRTESQRFANAALALYREEENEAGLAVYMALLLGLRTHEVMGRLARDVDDNGTLLWVTKSKSKAGIRQIEVPPVLAELLSAHIANKRPDERLFTAKCQHYVCEWTKKICRRAGLPEITGQGLRGTFATLAVSQGQVPLAVAGCIGHADAGITLGGNYAKLGSAQSGGAKRMETLLQRGTDSCAQPAPSRATVST